MKKQKKKTMTKKKKNKHRAIYTRKNKTRLTYDAS